MKLYRNLEFENIKEALQESSFLQDFFTVLFFDEKKTVNDGQNLFKHIDMFLIHEVILILNTEVSDIRHLCDILQST